MLNRIAFIVAMRQEAQPIIEHFKLEYISNVFDKELPMEVYRRDIDGMELYLVLNGQDPFYKLESIGTQSATIATLSTIQTINPDLIINAGTAGGFKKRGAKIGDVYSALSGVYFHDRKIPMGDYHKMGLGKHNCLEIPNISKSLGLKQGIATTGDSLNMSTDDKKIIDSYKGEMKDMEAAAIARVCQLYNKPLIIIKSITDIVDGEKPTADEFLENINQAAINLKEKCLNIIHYIKGKSLSEIN